MLKTVFYHNMSTFKNAPFNELMKQKLRVSLHENQYIVPSYTLYGGYSGFHDYGVLGIKIKNKLLNHWREFFLHQDDINEIETPIIMPYDILKASGHVDRFIDYMVTDGNNKQFRADHLVKDYLQTSKDVQLNKLADQVDSFSREELEYYINQYKLIKNENNETVKVVEKNLMFEVPSLGNVEKPDFLRPELAQGIFVSLKNYIQFSRNSGLPFGLAQIGKSYRKEITPQQFTRMREFTQAEIEFFVDPNNKDHPNFNDYKDYKIPILTCARQMNNEELETVSLQEALNTNKISHQTIAYFLTKIHKFAITIGLNPDKIRFRQHQKEEMAHYALECWDLETFVDNNWLECIGLADRGDYDLRAHNLTVQKKLSVPRIEKKLVLNVNKKVIAKKYNVLTQSVIDLLDGIKESEQLVKMQSDLESFSEYTVNVTVNNEVHQIALNSDMINIGEKMVTVEYENMYPHTVEPSFGIDRLMYSIFEHNFWLRPEDKKGQRVVLSLPELLVPYHIAIFPLYNKENLNNVATQIKQMLKKNNIQCYIDNSNVSIGKKYSRLDEIGVKYAITVDLQTLEDNTVTIRDRDTMEQVRKNVNAVI